MSQYTTRLLQWKDPADGVVKLRRGDESIGLEINRMESGYRDILGDSPPYDRYWWVTIIASKDGVNIADASASLKGSPESALSWGEAEYKAMLDVMEKVRRIREALCAT